MQFLFTVILSFFLIQSCHLKQADIWRVRDSIDLHNATQYETYPIDSLIFEVSAIPLEFNGKNLFKRIDKLLEFNNNYYILDSYDRQGIFVFDTTGKYLFEIGKVGGGKDRYSYPHDMIIDSSTNELYVLDSEKKRILIFNAINGQFKSSLVNNNSCTKFWKNKEDGTWWLTGGNNNMSISLYDHRFKLKMGYIKRQTSENKLMAESFLQVGDTLNLYLKNFSDTIYAFTNEIVLPYRKIVFDHTGNQTNKTDSLQSQEFPFKPAYLFRYYFEDPEHIFFTYKQNGVLLAALKNKITDFFITFPAINSNDNPFFSNGIPDIITVNSKGFYYALGDGNMFYQLMRKKDQEAYLNTFSNRLQLADYFKNENLVSNPVLIKFRFR